MSPKQVLNQVTPDPKGASCEAALKNNSKNRSLDFLPSETLLTTLWCVPVMNVYPQLTNTE